MKKIQDELAERGAMVQLSWLESLKPPPSSTQHAWDALLDADLKVAGAMVLPAEISAPQSDYHGTHLTGPILLQGTLISPAKTTLMSNKVEDMQNVAENWKGRKLESSNRCLKLTYA